MGISRWFGRPSLEERVREATGLLEAQRFGEAKLAFERARAQCTEADEAMCARLTGLSQEAVDGIVRKRLAEADACLAAGRLDLAQEELAAALEIDPSAALRDEVVQRQDELHRSAVTATAADTPPSFDEECALLRASWEDAQAEEYDDYGAELEEALVALQGGQAAEALPRLRRLFAAAEAPRYLWLELGRCLVQCEGDDEDAEGEAALRTFLDLLEDGEGTAGRLLAHRLLAEQAEGRGNLDAALAELEAAAAALPSDPRPYLELGAMLRRAGRADEAIEVLTLAVDGSEETPPWQLLAELGLAQEAAGQDGAAIATLEGVVEVFAGKRLYDFPPPIALPLARLHERLGHHERAADLYRILASGSDRSGRASYYLNAGRLLAGLGLFDEARVMLTRAEALAQASLREVDGGAETGGRRTSPGANDRDTAGSGAAAAAEPDLDGVQGDLRARALTIATEARSRLDTLAATREEVSPASQIASSG